VCDVVQLQLAKTIIRNIFFKKKKKQKSSIDLDPVLCLTERHTTVTQELKKTRRSPVRWKPVRTGCGVLRTWPGLRRPNFLIPGSDPIATGGQTTLSLIMPQPVHYRTCGRWQGRPGRLWNAATLAGAMGTGTDGMR
jgi:hypothetical protein